MQRKRCVAIGKMMSDICSRTSRDLDASGTARKKPGISVLSRTSRDPESNIVEKLHCHANRIHHKSPKPQQQASSSIEITMKNCQNIVLAICTLLLYCHTLSALPSDENSTEPDTDAELDSASSHADEGIDSFVSPVKDDDDDGSLIEANPNYVEESTNDGSCDDVDGLIGKGELEKELGLTKTTLKKSSLFLKRYRFKISLVLLVIAFRREIHFLFSEVISSGPRVLKANPTAILKIVLVLYMLKPLGGESSSMSQTILLMLGQLTGSQGIAYMLSGLLSPSNPSYVPPINQHYTFECLNDRYTKDQLVYSKVTREPKRASIKQKNDRNVSQLVAGIKQLHTLLEDRPKYNSTLIVMDWTGLDTSVSRLGVLQDEVSFLIDCYVDREPLKSTSNSKENFEVVVLLESPGGSASEYALAAQQILRLRNQGVNVTICVDKVAASGGYMIACTSSPGQLFAAPFALLGSVGVIGQSINIHNVLRGWGVTPLVFRGGKDKAPVGLIGEVTQEGKEKVQLMVDDIHRAFKRHVADSRPVLADRIEDVSTGDVWLGHDALDMGLVDRIVTSNEYIRERIQKGTQVLKLYKMVHTRGIFSQRTALSSTGVDFDGGAHPSVTQLRSIFSIVSDLFAIFGSVHSSLSTFVSTTQDQSSLARVAAVREIPRSSV